MANLSDNALKGAALIARAMRDSDLRDQLKADPAGTMRAHGVEPIAGDTYIVSEDTPNHFNVVVPSQAIDAAYQVTSIDGSSTPAQMYRWAVTEIQNGGSSKAALLSDAAAAVRSAGGSIPAAMTISVLEDTATTIHLNIPWTPSADTDVELQDSDVAALAGGKSTVGVEQTVAEATTVDTSAEVVAEAVEAVNVATTETAAAETTVVAVVEAVVVPILIT
jgi:hypothetical protein